MRLASWMWLSGESPANAQPLGKFLMMTSSPSQTCARPRRRKCNCLQQIMTLLAPSWRREVKFCRTHHNYYSMLAFANLFVCFCEHVCCYALPLHIARKKVLFAAHFDTFVMEVFCLIVSGNLDQSSQSRFLSLLITLLKYICYVELKVRVIASDILCGSARGAF
jgi:hypothetical protein